MADRYEGQKFRACVDAFVLWTIGALDDKTDAALQAMTPKLREVFGMKSGTWQDVVMTQMDFDEAYVEWLREKWRRQLEHDRNIGQEHNPKAWAHAITDFIGADDLPSMS
jgi:hypothetical protein